MVFFLVASYWYSFFFFFSCAHRKSDDNEGAAADRSLDSEIIAEIPVEKKKSFRSITSQAEVRNVVTATRPVDGCSAAPRETASSARQGRKLRVSAQTFFHISIAFHSESARLSVELFFCILF
jgi:hypothetical protein